MPAIDDGFGRLIDRGDRLLRPVENLLNFIAAIAVLFLMALGVVQSFLRQSLVCPFRWTADPAQGETGWLSSLHGVCIPFPNNPIFGYFDMIELAMPILAILGISYCQRHGVHIRMDILIQNLRGRTLWVVETFNAAIMLIIVALLTRFSWVFFMDAYTSGDSTVDAQYLTWPSKLLVPLALGILSLRLVIQLLGSLRLAIDPDAELIGVIAPADVAQQARGEIREALGEEAAR
jgi:TRAP-type C4-dicarboxylate transport system permease small subunit